MEITDGSVPVQVPVQGTLSPGEVLGLLQTWGLSLDRSCEVIEAYRKRYAGEKYDVQLLDELVS